MHCVLLGLELAGLTPEAKFVLVRLLQLYGLGGAITIGVKELAKVTGATDHVVSSALSELIKEDLLICTPIVIGRGRPRSEYQASSKLAKLLTNREAAFNEINRSKIDYVLHAATEKCKSSLSICNRLLLSTLLLYADQFGVVRGIGVSQVSRVTGLNRERIKTQVHKLIALRIMRGVIPGRTTSTLLGVSTSVYFLNFHHDVFQEGGSGVVVLTVTSNTHGDSGEMSELGAIIDAVKFSKGLKFEMHKRFSGLLPENDKFNGLAEVFFRLAKDQGSLRGLQVKLEEYASELLSKNWTALELGLFRSDSKLLVRIKEYFGRAVKLGRGLGGDGEREALFFEFMYEVVVLMAHRVQSMVRKANDFPYEISCIQILPSFSPGGYFGSFSVGRSLLIVPRNEFRAGECYVMSKNSKGDPVCKKFSSERDIPETDLYRFGLLLQVHTPKRYQYRS
ncbi:hypothetical protein [Pseudomonas sp. NY15354]|uniref:hypothetical protein n=1 Tax=Pseudomonas sp. NY15354 TaxID=3400351 RepID=UPI003A8A0541